MRVRQRIKDFRKHRIKLLQDLVVPKTQDAVAARIQKFGARVVMLGQRPMLPTVNFNHKPFLDTDEIYDIGHNGILTPELASAQLARPQAVPKLPFGVGLIFAQ